MGKNSNDLERAKYDRLILEKETLAEDLKDEGRKMQGSLSDLREDLQRGYRELSMLHEEDIYEGNRESLRLQRENEAQEQLFRHRLEEMDEQISEEYQSEVRKIENEKEELYRKRGDIPWD